MINYYISFLATLLGLPAGFGKKKYIQASLTNGIVRVFPLLMHMYIMTSCNKVALHSTSTSKSMSTVEPEEMSKVGLIPLDEEDEARYSFSLSKKTVEPEGDLFIRVGWALSSSKYGTSVTPS